jgi:hypothetical protein
MIGNAKRGLFFPAGSIFRSHPHQSRYLNGWSSWAPGTRTIRAISPAQAHLKLARWLREALQTCKARCVVWGPFGVAIIDPQYEFWPHVMISLGIREMVIGFMVPCFGRDGIRSRVVFCEGLDVFTRYTILCWGGKVNRVENRNEKNRYKRSLISVEVQIISSTTISTIKTV